MPHGIWCNLVRVLATVEMPFLGVSHGDGGRASRDFGGQKGATVLEALSWIGQRLPEMELRLLLPRAVYTAALAVLAFELTMGLTKLLVTVWLGRQGQGASSGMAAEGELRTFSVKMDLANRV